MSEYDPATDYLVIDAECVGADRVEIDFNRGRSGAVTVNAYDAFEIAGRIQAAAVHAMMGMDAPATYNPEQLARIEKLKKVLPDDLSQQDTRS